MRLQSLASLLLAMLKLSYPPLKKNQIWFIGGAGVERIQKRNRYLPSKHSCAIHSSTPCALGDVRFHHCRRERPFCCETPPCRLLLADGASWGIIWQPMSAHSQVRKAGRNGWVWWLTDIRTNETCVFQNAFKCPNCCRHSFAFSALIATVHKNKRFQIPSLFLLRNETTVLSLASYFNNTA